MAENLRDWLIEHGFGEGLALYSAWLGLTLAVILLAVVANYIAKKFLLVGIAFAAEYCLFSPFTILEVQDHLGRSFGRRHGCKILVFADADLAR